MWSMPSRKPALGPGNYAKTLYQIRVLNRKTLGKFKKYY